VLNPGSHPEPPLQASARSPLIQALAEAERAMMAELEAARELLGLAMEAALVGSEEAAEEVERRSHDLEQRHADVHDLLLALVARQAPVARDLRLALALLHVNERIERMARQCHNIATLSRAIPGSASVSDEQRACLTEMSRLADEQAAEAARVFAERDADGARALREHDQAINGHNRRCFVLAVQDGTDEARREGAFCVALMARALERFGDNAVDIGRQAAFVVTGRLRPAPGADASPPGPDPDPR
jgi:phosphate transport system protein